MANTGEAYADGRSRIRELLADITDDDGRRPVPACPDWTVHDVAAHLVGACADILAGRIDGVGTDPWTAVQVAARTDHSMSELLAEWAEVAPQVEAFAHAFPGRSGDQWVMDQITHEHDLRGALDRPGGRDSVGLDVGLGFVVEMGLAGSLEARGPGPLQIIAGGREWLVGPEASEGSEPARLEADPFELFRALSGRRSANQIWAFDWSVDATSFIPAFQYGPFTTRADDLVE